MRAIMEDIRALVRKEWDTLVEVRAQQAEMLKTLREITSDHEKRIRSLERMLGYGAGALAMVKFLFDYVKQ